MTTLEYAILKQTTFCTTPLTEKERRDRASLFPFEVILTAVLDTSITQKSSTLFVLKILVNTKYVTKDLQKNNLHEEQVLDVVTPFGFHNRLAMKPGSREHSR